MAYKMLKSLDTLALGLQRFGKRHKTQGQVRWRTKLERTHIQLAFTNPNNTLIKYTQKKNRDSAVQAFQ
uniref:Uncharacterized protein n=1 Tax=Solanum tuberosum TaxID=4113 RepID=M1A9K1_SOLTU